MATRSSQGSPNECRGVLMLNRNNMLGTSDAVEVRRRCVWCVISLSLSLPPCQIRESGSELRGSRQARGRPFGLGSGTAMPKAVKFGAKGEPRNISLQRPNNAAC